MNAFIDTISSYPTSVFTTILGVMLVFWVFAILGMLDIDLIPTGMDGDAVEPDFDVEGKVPGFVGLLHTLGLTGVPITVVISIISLIGFTLCYFVSDLVLARFDSPLVQYVGGTLLLVAGFGIAIPITATAVAPLKPLFVRHFAPSKRDFVGQVCTVTSSTVSDAFGIGLVETNGPPLQINIRTPGKDRLEKGMPVRITNYDEARDVFDVISEEEFQAIIG